MRILVVGAGAVGGYFGGRLLEAGRDVTFLVRAERAARLAVSGLVIKSGFGDANLPSPPILLAAEVRTPFDVVFLSCKSYDLERGGRTEADHILGDLLQRCEGNPVPGPSLLRITYIALKAYEARAAREKASREPRSQTDATTSKETRFEATTDLADGVPPADLPPNLP